MSKIYEALIRAEQERSATEKTSPIPDRSVSVEEKILGLATARASAIADTEPPFADGARDTLAGSSPLRFMPAAELKVWQPDFTRLPSALPRGGKTEQFRRLRSKLAGLRHLQQLHTISVVSGHAGEGKSFVASNLAVSLARHKSSRVLLIDGDMRRGTLHKILGAPNEAGLAEYLSGKANPSEIFQRGQAAENEEPFAPGLANLTFCSCGHAHDRAAELSGSSRFPELLKGVAEDYDWIILDTSPVNIVSDGVNLARACDSGLMVVRGGQTKFEAAQRALKELKATKLLGVVLNAVTEQVQSEGDYGYLGYGNLNE